MNLKRPYFNTPKLGIRIYRQRISGYSLIGIFLLIFMVFCFSWFYCDIWIGNWLSWYWESITSIDIKEQYNFNHLWIQPLWLSLIITYFFTIILMVIIDLTIEGFKAIDWIISIIKRRSFKRKKYYYILGLCLIFLPLISCKRYDRMVEEFRTINAISSCKTLDPSFDDTIKAKQICELILQIKDNQSNYEDMPWEDIAKSMLTMPDSVIFNYDTCTKCDSVRTQLYFQSPEWTWQNLCGRAGHMVICPICKTQDFHLEIMN